MKNKKWVVPTSRPRNTVATQAMVKTGSGSHRKSEKAVRRQGKIALKSGRDFFQTSVLYFGLTEA